MSEIPFTDDEINSFCIKPDLSTKEFFNQQTMLRIKDVKKSLNFYTNVLGMRLLKHLHFKEMRFSLYFVGYEEASDIPSDAAERTRWALSRRSTVELTQSVPLIGAPKLMISYPIIMEMTNPEDLIFVKIDLLISQGHIGLHVPDVEKACERFEKENVKFIKKPNEGKMKGLAFIQDPDGYWIEILNSVNISNI